MINVTKTYLPDKEKFKSYIDQIFDSGWLTNNGNFTKELQKRLSEYLGVKNLLLVSNGTLALQVAYKLLELTGDVLTTPFSFVATTSSIVWEGLNPIFVDIDPNTFNLDARNIEKNMTSRTTGIVSTHVYGNGCDIEQIDFYSRKYNLKVVYDAAHAFGVKYNNQSILNFGDISTISFHGTKIFHTVEGGALVIKDDALFERAKRMINFGIISPTEIFGVGINTKLNEFQSAMGLCVLDDMDKIFINRQQRFEFYIDGLASVKGISFQKRNKASTANYGYFPVLFENEEILLNIVRELNKQGISPRRYFYPSLETLDYLPTRQKAVNANDISKRILCLPLYDSLSHEAQMEIVDIVKHICE
jgi:dTDP-4-amino-4,6-dideoxygalactose transaminase